MSDSARLIRRLVVDAGTEIHIAIQHARQDRVVLDERIEQLQGRLDRLDRITALDDDLLERLVHELGATLHTPPAFEERS